MLRSLVLLLFLISLLCLTKAKPCIPQDDPPKLTLPWGTYLAEPYGEDSEIAHFKNVRFGKNPIGELRFRRPESPDAIDDNSTVQDSSLGASCIQASINATNPSPPPGGKESEDCLFLDVYVPYSALQPKAAKLPVVVYIFGGAYIYGGKDTIVNETNWSLYDGKGIFNASDNGIIWVVGNYRLGAFGWLAGKTMEGYATPNVGLYDQRLVFEWVQTYIDQVNGDKAAVSAWGNSAGGGSIIHHLTAFGGRQPPLFQRAVLWSPAYQWAWDRSGTLEDKFLNFATEAGCGGDYGDALSCLMEADETRLKTANQRVVTTVLMQGLFPFGPAVDGSWVESLAPVQLLNGGHTECGSMIISHVMNEAGIFVRDWIKTRDNFTTFINDAFPGKDMQEVRDAVENQYPATGAPFYGDQQARVRKLLQDSTFVCNARQLYDAYQGGVYIMQYNFPPGLHGTDLIASCWYEGVDIATLIRAFIDISNELKDVINILIGQFASVYQRYFASHAVSGDPNMFNLPNAVKWPIAEDDGDKIVNALKAGGMIGTVLYNVAPDRESTLQNCEFWNEVALLIDSLYRSRNKKTASTGLKNQAPAYESWTGLELKRRAT